MALETIILLAILTGLFYLAAAIISAAMFSSEVKKWSWLNLIMAVAISFLWVFNLLPFAERAMLGIVAFLICFMLWDMAGDVTTKKAVWASVATITLWLALCWLLIVLLHLFNVNIEFIDRGVPILFGFLT